MRTFFRHLTIASLLILPSCVSLVKPPKEATITYLLNLNDVAPATEGEPLPLVLYVPRATAPSFLDSTKIVFSRSADTVNAYQYAQWAEPPPARLTSLLVQQLEQRGIFKAVTRHTSATSPDLALNIDLLDFRHDATATPGTAVLRLRAEIVDTKNSRIVATRLFDERADVASADAASVAQTLGDLARRSVKNVTDWIGELASKPLPRAVVVER